MTVLPKRAVKVARVLIPKTILVLPAIVTLVLSLVFWQGMRATDDLAYARRAMSIGQEPASLIQQPSHRDARIGMIYPLAAVFSILGTSDFSLALLPLICSVLTASLVAWLGYWFWGEAAGLGAGLLYAVFPLTVNLSTFYVPEPILQFEICIATALFLWATGPQARNAGRVEFLAGVVVGIAYLTKEVAALMLPAFYLYLLIGRRICRRDASLFAGFAVVLSAELAYYTVLHGNPLYRFTLAAGYLSDPLLIAANSDLPYRLFKTIPGMFLFPDTEFGLFGPLLVLAGLYGLIRWRESLLFVIWAAFFLLFYNFMTVSLRHYIVLPVTGRLLAPACLPLLILSGKMVADVWKRVASSSSGFIRYSGHALFVSCAFALTISSFLVMHLNRTPTFTGAVAQNAKQAAKFLEGYSSITLVTDRRTARAMQFYRHFNPRDSFLEFEAASRLGSQLQDDPVKPAFVVLNGPIIHEGEIKGQLYGRRFLGAGDRASLPEFLPRQGAEVFSTQIRRSQVLETFLGYAPARHLLEQLGYQTSDRLFAESPPLGDVKVFRLGERRANPTQSVGRTGNS